MYGVLCCGLDRMLTNHAEIRPVGHGSLLWARPSRRERGIDVNSEGAGSGAIAFGGFDNEHSS